MVYTQNYNMFTINTAEILEEASGTRLSLSGNCLLLSLIVNLAPRGDAPVAEKTKRLKGRSIYI